MPFNIYLRDNIGNEITQFLDIPKLITVNELTITDGMLIKGNFRIPIHHILFIWEV